MKPVTPSLPDDALCLFCGYLLRGLPGGTCPECGRAFNPSDPATWATEPPNWLTRRWTVLPLCIVFYALLCVGMFLHSPWMWHQYGTGAVGGPLLSLELVPPWWPGVFALVSCVAAMAAHPLRPGRSTALVTASAFVGWYVCGRLAWIAAGSA